MRLCVHKASQKQQGQPPFWRSRAGTCAKERRDEVVPVQVRGTVGLMPAFRPLRRPLPTKPAPPTSTTPGVQAVLGAQRSGQRVARLALPGHALDDGATAALAAVLCEVPPPLRPQQGHPLATPSYCAAFFEGVVRGRWVGSCRPCGSSTCATTASATRARRGSPMHSSFTAVSGKRMRAA